MTVAVWTPAELHLIQFCICFFCAVVMAIDIDRQMEART